jgi:hypothetical protein
MAEFVNSKTGVIVSVREGKTLGPEWVEKTVEKTPAGKSTKK